MKMVMKTKTKTNEVETFIILGVDGVGVGKWCDVHYWEAGFFLFCWGAFFFCWGADLRADFLAGEASPEAFLPESPNDTLLGVAFYTCAKQTHTARHDTRTRAHTERTRNRSDRFNYDDEYEDGG